MLSYIVLWWRTLIAYVTISEILASYQNIHPVSASASCRPIVIFKMHVQVVLTNQPTPMEDSPWKASQKITLKFNDCVHKTPPLVTIMSKINAINTPKPHFANIHFNIISPRTYGASEWSLPFRLSNQKLCTHFSPSLLAIHDHFD
jgi:hypothetical protein